MVIRQRKELTQIAVLEDKVLVEHYVARESQTSLIGNVYLGRVQNVLPSMEAAFIDIGKGRNAVLYAGEVNWAALGHKEGQPRKIESVLSSGQPILVQVTKDPIGHKGARLTSQVSLAGRFLVYVPDGTTSGISRKLPDTERNRLKTLLKEIVPDSAGVIVRTAAEGASEDELTRDVERLKARWEDIEGKARGQRPGPALRRAGPDPQGRPRPLHRGLHQAGHPGRRRLGDRPGVRRARRPRPRRTGSRSSSPPEGAAAKKADIFAVVPHRRADREGPGPQGLAALRRLAGHRPHRGDDRRRRQHRQVHRLRGQPGGDGHQEQPRGRRGDRPPAPAARHRRHHRRRLHRHGPGVQPRPGRPPPRRVPRSRPHPSPGRRGHLARPGADDPQADRHRPARVLQPRLRGLPRPWCRGPERARRVRRRRGRRAPARRSPWPRPRVATAPPATAAASGNGRRRSRSVGPVPQGRRRDGTRGEGRRGRPGRRVRCGRRRLGGHLVARRRWQCGRHRRRSRQQPPTPPRPPRAVAAVAPVVAAGPVAAPAVVPGRRVPRPRRPPSLGHHRGHRGTEAPATTEGTDAAATSRPSNEPSNEPSDAPDVSDVSDVADAADTSGESPVEVAAVDEAPAPASVEPGTAVVDGPSADELPAAVEPAPERIALGS